MRNRFFGLVGSTHTKAWCSSQVRSELMTRAFCRHLEPTDLPSTFIGYLLVDLKRTWLSISFFPSFQRFYFRLAVQFHFVGTHSPETLGRRLFDCSRVGPRFNHIPMARPRKTPNFLEAKRCSAPIPSHRGGRSLRIRPCNDHKKLFFGYHCSRLSLQSRAGRLFG